MISASLRRSRPRRRAAVTLLEMVLAISVFTIIMGTMWGSVLVASRAVGGTQSTADVTSDAAEVADRIATDLRFALGFSERSPAAVTFTVPDRDGDKLPETIRYAWPAPSGDPIAADPRPLTMEYNGSDPIVITEDAYLLDFSYLETTIAGTGGVSEVGNGGDLEMLFVVKKAGNLEDKEIIRKFLLEAWGYTVAEIDDEASQAEFEDAFGLVDVVYVSDRVDANKIGTKLNGAAIGIVTERRDMALLLDLSEKKFDTHSETSFIINDNSHYITKPFFPGLLPIFSQNCDLLRSDGELAPGATLLGSQTDDPTRLVLLTIEAGELLYSGERAAGRRVVLPWGDNTDFNRLNDSARTLLRRTFEWAASAEAEDVVDSPLFDQQEDPGVSDKNYTIKSDKWAVASIVPDLPADAISWRITRFRFIARQKGSSTETLVIQVRGRDASGAPTDDVLAQAFLGEESLPTDYDWVEVELTTEDPIPASRGACIAVGMLSGTDAGEVLYEEGNGTATPANQFYSGKPGAWDSPNENKDMPCEVHGTTESSSI